MGGSCKMQTKYWSENPKRRDHSKDLGLDGKIILEWILGKQGGRVWNGFMFPKKVENFFTS
jgi:hypothetical protein